MTRLLVTSVVREAGLDEGSGFLRVVDLDERRVIYCEQVPDPVWRSNDPNPRGGLRGARGMCIWRGMLVLANADTLFFIRPDWTLDSMMTNPLFGSIHGIDADEYGIYVACSYADLIVKVSPDKDRWKPLWIWDWRRSVFARRTLPVEPEDFQPAPSGVDYRDPANQRITTWLNGVKVYRDKAGRERLLVCMGNMRGEAFLLSLVPGYDRHSRLVDRHKLIGERPSHGIAVSPQGEIWWADTGRALLCGPLGPVMAEEQPVERGGYLRGMTFIDGALWRGGQKPFRITDGVGTIDLGGDDRESVYFLQELPEHFDRTPKGIFPFWPEQAREVSGFCGAGAMD
jgi:hypothetical protein